MNSIVPGSDLGHYGPRMNTATETPTRAALHIPSDLFTDFLSNPIELVRHALQCPANAHIRVALEYRPDAEAGKQWLYVQGTGESARIGFGSAPAHAVRDYLRRQGVSE